MTRNVRAEAIEAVARPIVAVGNDYPAGHTHPNHRHLRSQLLFAERGTMLVRTGEGAWMVPPHQGIWIPAGIEHSIAMLGAVSTRSVYLESETAVGMPTHCQVLGISPLLRELLIEAVDLPSEYDTNGRAGMIMSLAIEEIRVAPELPLSLPLPTDEKLAARCRRFLEHPSAQQTIDLWCRDLAVSRRTFTRRFQRETGLTFSAWQRRACLVSVLPRLLRGERVTTLAFDLGYSSPAAFTIMFKQIMGTAPQNYRCASHGVRDQNSDRRVRRSG